ncbi:hypothetical protein ACS0TY_026689 [Phlomoides rotata]
MALTPAATTTTSIPKPISYTHRRRTEALLHKTPDLHGGGGYRSPNQPRRLLVHVRGLEAPHLHLRPHCCHTTGVHGGIRFSSGEVEIHGVFDKCGGAIDGGACGSGAPCEQR